MYIGSFCPAMTSLRKYLQEAAFSILIFPSVFIFLWLFSKCIMDIVSSSIVISRPSLRKCTENNVRPTGKKSTTIGWDDGGKIDNKNEIILTEIFPSVQKHDI